MSASSLRILTWLRRRSDFRRTAGRGVAARTQPIMSSPRFVGIEEARRTPGESMGVPVPNSLPKLRSEQARAKREQGPLGSGGAYPSVAGPVNVSTEARTGPSAELPSTWIHNVALSSVGKSVLLCGQSRSLDVTPSPRCRRTAPRTTGGRSRNPIPGSGFDAFCPIDCHFLRLPLIQIFSCRRESG